MPLSAQAVEQVEQAANRLAGEVVMATPGKDDGLIPAYSLLSELLELTAADPAWSAPLTEARGVLDRLLDSGQPFDAATLQHLKQTVEWLQAAVAAGQPANGGANPASGDKSISSSIPFTAGSDGATGGDRSDTGGSSHLSAEPDEMLAFDLAESRDLLTEFHAETAEHLAQIEAGVLALEGRPDDPEALNGVFRSFHTIKGNSGFLGLKPMQRLAHEVETLLDLARNRELAVSQAVVTEILHSRDAIEALNRQIGVALDDGSAPDQIIPVQGLIIAVKTLVAGAAGAPATSAPAPSGSAVQDFVVDSVSGGQPVRQRAPASGLAHPCAGETSDISSQTAKGPAGVEAWAVDVARRAGGAAAAAEAGGAAGPGPIPSKIGSAPENGAAEAAGIAGKGNEKGAGRGGASTTVRVNIEKLDTLMDVVGELVIVHSQLAETARRYSVAAPPLAGNVGQLNRITKELQSTAMALRMIPIQPTFQKMERLARDLARDCRKAVTFTTRGGDTELDRTMVEEIADPLVHMVRNALDHGLEPEAERVANGKPALGSVELRAYHQGGQVLIELRDDGRGIDPEKVFAKARRQGLVPDGPPPPVEQIYQYIFLPGFSTAEKVTALSGRGVGMDVVKRNVERLRGKIDIASTLGQGTTFTIRLPLTMAIIDGLVVRVGSDRFILPTTSVSRALRPARDRIVQIHGCGEVLDLNGKMIPLHRLHRHFGIPAQAQEPWEGILVIVETSGRSCALLVDEMISKQEVVIKNLGAFMAGLTESSGVAGGAILGDGQIALILDPAALLRAA